MAWAGVSVGAGEKAHRRMGAPPPWQPTTLGTAWAHVCGVRMCVDVCVHPRSRAPAHAQSTRHQSGHPAPRTPSPQTIHHLQVAQPWWLSYGVHLRTRTHTLTYTQYNHTHTHTTDRCKVDWCVCITKRAPQGTTHPQVKNGGGVDAALDPARCLRQRGGHEEAGERVVGGGLRLVPRHVQQAVARAAVHVLACGVMVVVVVVVVVGMAVAVGVWVVVVWWGGLRLVPQHAQQAVAGAAVYSWHKKERLREQ